MKNKHYLMWIRTSLVLLMMFLVSQTTAQKIKYEEGKVYEHYLDNGLKVLTVERHIAPLIYHQLTYKVGARNEQLGMTGISHIVEHMMFKGTNKYAKGEVSKLISQNSGIFNAFTANDMTSYYEYVPANKIELPLDIESDRMQNSIFDPEEFKSEIEVIKQERRMRSESSPQGILNETMNSVAYQSHPNRDPIIGWPSDLSRVTRDEAYEYYKTYYTPNNAFLVLVGDFQTDEMMKLVDKYYGRIPKGPEVEELVVVEQLQKVTKSFTVTHNDITEPSFRMAFHIPAYNHPDAPILRVAGMILCEKARTARLYKRLVDETQIATGAAGGFGMSKDPTLFSLTVGMKPDSSIEKAQNMVWEEIEKMKKEPVNDHELQKIKNRFRFGQVTSYTKNNSIGERLSKYEAFFGYKEIDTFFNRIMTVTKEDITKVMNEYFNIEGMTIAYLQPKDKSKKAIVKKNVSTDEDEEVPSMDESSIDLLNLLPEEKFYYKDPSPENVIIEALEKSADEIIRPQPIAPLIKTMTLSNGVKVYTVENHLVPAVSIIGVFETGNIPEANEGGQPGIATILGDVMGRGTEKMPYKELSERMAFVPFQFQAGGSYRGFYFEGYSLIKDADEMMKTGFEIITKPAYDEQHVKKLKAHYELTARNKFKKTGMRAFYHMYNTLFEDHPYSKVSSTEESIKSITKEDLKKLHDKYFRPDRLTLLMVGDMSAKEMRDLANKYFGKWKTSGKAPKIYEIPKNKDFTIKEIKVFPEKDYTECTINLGFAPRNDIDPDEAETVNVLNYILASSALTSRMGVELRDKQGLIYGLKSELWAPNDNIGYWKFNTKTGPQNVEKVIKGIFSEIRKLLDKGISDEELSAAKNRMLGLLPFYVETPDDVASRAYDLIRQGLPFNYFDKKGERIVKVSKEDVMRVAEKYFTLNKFIIVVDGPLEENALDHLTNEL